MSDERRNDSGATLAVVLIVGMVVLVGIVGVAGGGVVLYLRARYDAERARYAAMAELEQTRFEQDRAESLAAELRSRPQLEGGIADERKNLATTEIALAIDAEGSFRLRDKELNPEQLKAALAAAYADQQLQGQAPLELVISAAPETGYERVVAAIDAAKAAQIDRIRFANLAPSEQPAP